MAGLYFEEFEVGQVFKSDEPEGQLIAATVLLEALLQTLPAQQLKQVQHLHHQLGTELQEMDQSQPCSDVYLASLERTLEAQDEMLSRVTLAAIRQQARMPLM